MALAPAEQAAPPRPRRPPVRSTFLAESQPRPDPVARLRRDPRGPGPGPRAIPGRRRRRQRPGRTDAGPRQRTLVAWNRRDPGPDSAIRPAPAGLARFRSRRWAWSIDRVLSSGQTDPRSGRQREFGAPSRGPGRSASAQVQARGALMAVPLEARGRVLGAADAGDGARPGRRFGHWPTSAWPRTSPAAPRSPSTTRGSTETSRRTTAARTSSWRCSPTSCATPWPRSATPSRSSRSSA